MWIVLCKSSKWRKLLIIQQNELVGEAEVQEEDRGVMSSLIYHHVFPGDEPLSMVLTSLGWNRAQPWVWRLSGTDDHGTVVSRSPPATSPAVTVVLGQWASIVSLSRSSSSIW